VPPAKHARESTGPQYQMGHLDWQQKDIQNFKNATQE
jgi:hypothetical protein